jgi:hypothetical protein
MESKMFRIVVAGQLDRGFSAGLDGVSLRHDGAQTVLEGLFVDQSHLHGLLDRLRALGIEVTSFSTSATSEQPNHETRKP